MEYLIYLNDSKKIHSAKEELRQKCIAFLESKSSLITYESFAFIDGTGFTKKVRDEIDFVLDSQVKHDCNVLCKKDFINIWGFSEYLDYDVQHLSGGWKKYLGLALFSNIRSDGKIYFDACRQLSDRLIEQFISNVRKSKPGAVFYFELDAMLLSSFPFTVLYDTPDGFAQQNHIGKIIETNYE